MSVFRSFLSMLLLTNCLHSYCQQYDFAKIDSFAISIGKADSLTIPELTQLLTVRFKDPVLKTRAIYTWIAHNIAYDCPAYHVEAKRRSDPKDVFKYRKGVCAGYANLFQEMCSYANVQCIVIDGYGRGGSRAPAEKTGEINHAWNAVRINGEWKLVDVTWGSGYTDDKVRKFTQYFSDTYFFPDPHKFLLNHYPRLEAWKPAGARLSKQAFADNPTILAGYLQFDLGSFTPTKGVIKVKPKEPIHFSFSSSQDINSIQIIVGEEKKEERFHPEFTVTNGIVSFSFNYAKQNSHPLTVYVNRVAALQYQLEIRE
jgi:hypothetical protein